MLDLPFYDATTLKKEIFVVEEYSTDFMMQQSVTCRLMDMVDEEKEESNQSTWFILVGFTS